MPIFKKSNTRADPLIVSVTGARLGHAVLVVPGRDRRVVLDLASRVGLTGRTVALVDAAAVEATRSATEAAGALVEAAPLVLPFPSSGEPFDLTVVDDRTPRAATVATASLLPEILRSLRPGGRLVLLVPTGEGVLARLLGSSAEPPDAPERLAALARAGFRAGRLVASRDGVGYLEGTRPID
jgi:SAM-dependent methyltransferase